MWKQYFCFFSLLLFRYRIRFGASPSRIFCDDSSIKYPYEEPIVPTSFLLFFFIGVPISVISFLEYARMVKNDTFTIRKWLHVLEKILTVFAFGFGLSVLTVDIFNILGTLRPHFMSVCNPLGECLTNMTKIPNSNYVIGDNDICSCSNKDLISNARLSFMSGHASVSAFSSFFLIFYVQYRVKIEKKVLLIKPFLQYIFFILAALVSVSRVADHHHHWADVIAGFLNGTLFAAFCSFPILKYHHNRVFEDEKANHPRKKKKTKKKKERKI